MHGLEGVDVDSNGDHVWAKAKDSNSLWWRFQGDTTSEWTELSPGMDFASIDVGKNGEIYALRDNSDVWYLGVQY